MTEESGSPVNVARHGRILVVTLNRPGVRNAVNGAMARGIEEAIDLLEGDPTLNVGIINSTGPVFCSGNDLKAVSAGEGRASWTERGGFAGITRRSRRKILIAAIDGPAVGGGFEIALACDMIVVSDTASFALPEAGKSLLAIGGGLFRLPRVVPWTIALQMACTGDSLSAERAYQLGLANECTGTEPALTGAIRLAGRVLRCAPSAVELSREVILGSLPDDETGWRLSREAQSTVMRTDDYAEGLRAAAERRPPRWTLDDGAGS